MTKSLAVFLVLAALGNAVYHLGQKSVPAQAHPMVLLVGAYLVALLLSLAALPFLAAMTGGAVPPLAAWPAQMFNGPVVAIGVGAFLIETGFLLAYRSGGALAWSGVAVNTVAALILAPFAWLVFRESLSPTRLAGITLCLGGLWLLVRK